jgi:rod shape-determining protein MreC
MRPDWSYRPGVALLLVCVALGLWVRLLDPVTKQPLANTALKTAYTPFFVVQARVHQMVVASADNERLREQLADAQWRASRNEQAANVTETLRALLEQPPSTDRKVFVARVVGWERRGGKAEVIVNRGASGGLSRFSPALSESGVVGRVSEVMEDFARVRLLTDPACRVAVRDVRSGVLGVVRMSGDSYLQMDHVAIEADVLPGDQLVTAGIGGLFPEGLPVGTVTDVDRVPVSLLLGVQLEPSAAFEKLDYLFFLESEALLPPGAPYDVGTP